MYLGEHSGCINLHELNKIFCRANSLPLHALILTNVRNK